MVNLPIATQHNKHIIDTSKVCDAPRLKAYLRRYHGRSDGDGGGGAAAASDAPPFVLHFVPGDAGERAAAAAYVLAEQGHHGGPRYGLLPVIDDSSTSSDAVHGGAAAALAAIAAAAAQQSSDQLRFFGLPAPAATRAAAHVLPAFGYRRISDNPCVQYVLASPLSSDILARARDDEARLAAAGYELDLLRPSDAPLVDSLWPYRSANSLAFIRDRLILGGAPTACARLASSSGGGVAAVGSSTGGGSGDEGHHGAGGSAGEPVAWVVEYEDGSFGMLTTREGHRRRGLARAVLIRLIEELSLSRLEAHPLFCYVVEANEPSRVLLESLGFEATGVFCWQRWER